MVLIRRVPGGRVRRGPLVLLYHRVTEPGLDPFRLSVRPERFSEHLSILHQHYSVVPLDELADPARQDRLPERAVAISFDDGYRDNLLIARPLLEKAGLPATVFVVTGGFGQEFWWDELERVLLHSAALPDELCFVIAGRKVRWCAGEPAYRRRRFLPFRLPVRGPKAEERSLLYLLHPLLRSLDSPERREVLDQLWTWIGSSGPGTCRHRAMTASEVHELTRGGLITAGAHTVTHPVLARLSASREEAELRDSRRTLEEVKGGSVCGLAYPYGGHRDYSSRTVTNAQRAGYKYACTTHGPGFRLGPDPFRVPRRWVEDWDGTEFAQRMAAWMLPA